MNRAFTVTLLMVFLMILAGCTTPGATPDQPTAAPTSAAEPTGQPTAGPTAEPTMPPTEPPATSEPENLPPPDPSMLGQRNLFALLVGDTFAPEGWSVEPCEGDAPMLCVRNEAGGVVGGTALSIYEIETLPDFQRMLDEAGVESRPVNVSDAAERAALIEALNAFVEGYHAIIGADREAEYGDRVSYEELPTEEVSFGALPALRYGFAGVAEDGSVFERWVSIVAFDGDLMYILVAFFRPDETPGQFFTDEDLTAFLPHLDTLAAGMRVPLPVMAADVSSAQTLRDAEVFRSYTMQGNPAGILPQGETVAVTGVSPNQLFWRIDCPAGISGACWIPAEAAEPVP